MPELIYLLRIWKRGSTAEEWRNDAPKGTDKLANAGTPV